LPPLDDATVTLAAGKVPMDRDYVLRWRPAAGAVPEVTVYTETLDGETYALVILAPPKGLPPDPRPREMILVVDTSGSMQGASIRQAKRAASVALDALTARDRLNVIAFDDEPEALYPFPVPADARAIGEARRFLGSLEAGGGTEMTRALQAAFAPRPALEHVRQVVFVTDGAVAGEDGLIEFVRTTRGEARLFPVGIGAAPATHLLQRLADAGRGTSTHVASSEEVGRRVAALFSKLEHPVLTNVESHWSGGAEVWPRQVPDLYAGEPLVFAARLGAPRGVLAVSGLIGRRPWSTEIALSEARPAPGVGIVWARRKVAALTVGDVPGLDPVSIQAEITRVGLRHGLVTPYTSFVAAERRQVREHSAAWRDSVVPALAPAGGSRVGWPATATSAPLEYSLAAISMLLGALFWSLGRPGGD
jgi:Ca-activated chloride channel family protein